MTALDIDIFLHTQVACWNAGDKDGFFAAYRIAAKGGLTVEYVGRPAADGWAVLEQMWARQSGAVRIEVVQSIVNGREAACHHRNHVQARGTAIETIELYRFDEDGALAVRYFIALS